METQDMVKAMLEEYYGKGITEDLDDDDLNVRIYRAGRKEVVYWIRDNWHHIDSDMWYKQLDIWGVYSN